MSSLNTESTPRERLARAISVLARVRMYWRSTSAVIAVGLAISLAVALCAKRAWRSETTLLYREILQTGRDPQGSAARAARLGPKLKDTLHVRGTLAGVIQEFNLYPDKAARSRVEAVDEMLLHLGFRAQGGDTYAISFTYEDPAVAQAVAARLADILIEDYRRESLDSATMTRDFLRRELAEASAKVDEASRALATFLAKNPQFQWGLNDSPYAPTPQPAAPAPGGAAPRPPPPRATRPLDPELASLERHLARIDALLAPARPQGTAPGQPLPPSLLEAQRARDAASAAVAAAEAALAEKLLTVTAIHPDAVAAKNRLDLARRQLAAAESALRFVRAGVSQPPEGEGTSELTPARRASLEQERSALLGQIAARRARLAGGVEARRGAERAPKGGAPEARRDEPKRDARGGAADPDAEVIELETEWHRLRLALDRAREYLKSVQASERAADLAAAAAQNKSGTEVLILDPAYLPTRPDRGRGRFFLAGAVLTFFFAMGLAGARVLLNDTLYDDGDIHALGGPAVLASMPAIPAPRALRERPSVPAYAVVEAGAGRAHPEHAGGASTSVLPPPASAPPEREAGLACVGPRAMVPLPALHGGEPPEVEILGVDLDREGLGVFELLQGAPAPVLAALRVLRHRLDQRRGDAPFIVSVLSPGPVEGKTTLAVRLAMTLAEAERARVVLVEGHLERPRVAASLGLRLPAHAGLSEQIHRRMHGEVRPLGVVAVGPSLSVLAEPSGEAAYPAALHSTQFHAALRSLQRYHDYVVIDGPPVLGSGDANVIEDVSDGVVLVARASLTRASALTRAAEQLGERRILGVVLNDVTRRPVARKRLDPGLPQSAA